MEGAQALVLQCLLAIMEAGRLWGAQYPQELEAQCPQLIMAGEDCHQELEGLRLALYQELITAGQGEEEQGGQEVVVVCLL